MPVLVLDTCAATHAKHLSQGGRGPMQILDRLVAGYQVTVMTTKALHAEMTELTLTQNLQQWQALGRYVVADKVSVQQVKQVRNKLTRTMREPGKKDIGGIALALSQGQTAVLLTHDSAAAALARRCRVLTVDLLDVADLLDLVDSRNSPWLGELNCLESFAWKPDDWTGDASSTMQGRPRRDKVRSRLRTWMSPRSAGP